MGVCLGGRTPVKSFKVDGKLLPNSNKVGVCLGGVNPLELNLNIGMN